MGVVLGLIPVTNPVPTMIFKTLICLKSRNALIMSCHFRAVEVGKQAGDIIHAALCRHGALEDLIQLVPPPISRRKTAMFMNHPDVSFILATGGPSMVRAAYSSGTPAIGVGCGNAPVLICSDADLDTVAETVIASKSFDCGVICGSENNLVLDASIRDRFVSALEAHGAAILTPDQVRQLSDCALVNEGRHLNPVVIGKPARSILEQAGIDAGEQVRLIVVPLETSEVHSPWAHEKLAPIVSLITARDCEDGLQICRRILQNQGTGHTAIIHTRDQGFAERFGVEMPVSRSLVNCPGSQGCIGLSNGLAPSLTLGCGTFGGSSTTDNVTYTNLLNVKRIAHAL
jgi:acyl-CoA reductase-like NAD-dependent aldehyde dehydrogenase